jgi:uncharacterized protein YndB with AHSA1/START domain
MSTASARIVIERPIEDVFAVLTDVEYTGRWFPADVEEYWTSPPPHGLGSTRHAIVRTFGRTTENDAVTTEYDPPRRAAIRGTTPNAPFTAALDFVRIEAGTQVTATIEFAFRGAMRLFGPPVARWYGGAWQKGLANLERLMEAGEL